MRTMTLMAALAMVAATHSIATRTAAASDATITTAPAIRTFDLPTVRVYATVERDDGDAVAMQAPRIHDLPPVRVHAVADQRDVADVRNRAIAMRTPAARRTSLAIPRGSQRRGIAPEREMGSNAEERTDRWIALGCVVRLRLGRVWPMQQCGGGSSSGGGVTGTRMSLPMSLDRRR